MSAGSVSRPWRRYLRLSVRGLIVLVLVIGTALGWIADFARRAQGQHAAVAAIRKAGGFVYYDWQLTNGMLNQRRRPKWPKWLVDHLGVDCFGNVIFVINGQRFTDVELAQIGRLSRLKRLYASGSSVTDQGVAHLVGMNCLEWFDLRNSNVSDAGLEHVKGLPVLKTVILRGTRVSDAGVMKLQREFPKLSIR